MLPVFLTVGACSEPEQTTFALNISSIDDAEICAADGEGEERCFPRDALSIVDGTQPHLDDCVVVETTGDGDADADRAVWNGRCSTEPVPLGVTLWEGRPRVIVPECLGSLVSLRVEDEEGGIVWWVARDTSTQHPLIEHVTIGETPPGFVEHDPLVPTGPDTQLLVTATQQTELPDATGGFAIDDLDERVHADGQAFATAEEFRAEAGCRADG